MLSLVDFLIIYLACGASAGASYFFQNRKKVLGSTLWLKTFLTVVVWIPYALKFLHEFVTRKFPPFHFFYKFSEEDSQRQKLEQLEKEFSDLFCANTTKISVFEFREAFERYAGLSSACLAISRDETPSTAAQEVFRLTAHGNPPLGARCQFRRNAFKLRRHQKLAGRDLLTMFENFDARGEQSYRLQRLIIELFEMFADADALKTFDEIFPANSQTTSARFVPKTEKELWKTISIRQLPNLKTRTKQVASLMAKAKQD